MTAIWQADRHTAAFAELKKYNIFLDIMLKNEYTIDKSLEICYNIVAYDSTQSFRRIFAGLLA